MSSVYDVIRRPLITEKSSAMTELGGKYSFEVAIQADKPAIRKAVQQLFQVKVTEVRTSIVHGKVKRAGMAMKKRQNWKKAIVTLAPGNKIDFFGTAT